MSAALAKAIWLAKVAPRQPLTPIIVPKSRIESAPPPPPTVVIELPPPTNSVRYIARVVAQYYGILFGIFISPTRAKTVVLPRQVAMYLARTLQDKSLKRIGRALGNRDHATVLWGFRKIECLLGVDAELARQVEEIKSILQGE